MKCFTNVEQPRRKCYKIKHLQNHGTNISVCNKLHKEDTFHTSANNIIAFGLNQTLIRTNTHTHTVVNKLLGK